MDSVIEFFQNFNIHNIPANYLVIGGTVFFIFVLLLSDWLAPAIIGLIIRIFRFGGKNRPAGRELAVKMLTAVGETSVKVDKTIMDTSFRLAFNDIDYQPETNTLELTEDKVKSSKISSAGLVVLEVGRALQYRSDSVLVHMRRILTPFVNFAGFAWLFPFLASLILPIYFNEKYGAMISGICNVLVTAIFGIMGVFILLKVPLDLDAYRRGVSAMKKAGIFSTGEVISIRIFLILILIVTIFTTILLSLNFFKNTIPSKK
jgi:Zn-dependent membrane protease YugP